MWLILEERKTYTAYGKLILTTISKSDFITDKVSFFVYTTSKVTDNKNEHTNIN